MQDEISDGFGRVTQFSNTNSDPGDVYIQYSHIGPSRLAGRLSKSASGYKGNDTFLDLDSDGTGDNYAGLDLFGRIVSPKVTDEATSTNLSDIQYQSNRDGSPQFAQPQANVVIGRSSLYTYDNLKRLSQADLGLLNSGRTDLFEEWADPTQIIYTMDILGNMSSINTKNSGVDAVETRTHNATNELLTRAVVGEAKRYWVNDNFTDNDTLGWSMVDVDNDGTIDGSVSASSGTLAFTGVVSLTGSPDSATGAILLIDDEARQDIRITCDVTLDTDCENAGIVYGYVDNQNYWVTVWSKTGQSKNTYQISGGTWTQRGLSVGATITAGTPFSMDVEIRAGSAEWFPLNCGGEPRSRVSRPHSSGVSAHPCVAASLPVPRSLNPLAPRPLGPSIPWSLDPSIPRLLGAWLPRCLVAFLRPFVPPCLPENSPLTPRYSCDRIASNDGIRAPEETHDRRPDQPPVRARFSIPQSLSPSIPV